MRLVFCHQLAVTRGKRGDEVLPVLWTDNYFSLLPGETREVAAALATADLAGASPVLAVGGWNIESDFDCASLSVAPKEVKAGEKFTVTAKIGNTFLDGSRVTLRVDGKPVESKWAWARGNQVDTVAFTFSLDQPGRHRIQVGDESVRMTVR